MPSLGTFFRFGRMTVLAFIIAALIFVLGNGAAFADTAYFTYNSAESGIFQYFLTDTQTGTLRTSTMSLAPLTQGYTWDTGSAWSTKVMPSANTVAGGTWDIYLQGRCFNPAKVNLSVEIGEYTSGGAYNPWLTPTEFGWTAELGGSSALYTLSYADPSTHTLAAGSRLYMRVYARNIHNKQDRTVYFEWDSAAAPSRSGTPAFAQPIPALGWYLMLAVIIGFMFIAIRKGSLRLKRVKT